MTPEQIKEIKARRDRFRELIAEARRELTMIHRMLPSGIEDKPFQTLNGISYQVHEFIELQLKR